MIDKNNPRNKPEFFDHLVYVRLFEGCNLHCKHCFIPANPKKMDQNQFLRLSHELSSRIPKGSKILLQWHGGEPTALGPEVLTASLEAVEEGNKGYDFVYYHSIQTNLINYNEKWRDIFRTYFEGSVGVSWDPKIRLIKKSLPESNAAYESIFESNLRQLVADGIHPYLVVTATKVFFETFKYPSDFFAQLEDWGVTHAHIERLTKTGYARENWGEIGLDNLQYSKYMSRFAQTYHQYKKKPRDTINLSPFDGLGESVERLIDGASGGYGCLSGVCDSKFHTFDSNGYKMGCTALTSEIDNKNAGPQVIQFVGSLEREREVRQKSCEGCKFRSICSSGCMATDRFDHSGECSGAYLLFNNILNMKTKKRETIDQFN